MSTSSRFGTCATRVALALATALIAQPAAAQDRSCQERLAGALPLGTAIGVELVDSLSAAGVLLDLGPDALRMKTLAGDSVTFPYARLRQLNRRTFRPMRGAMLGGLYTLAMSPLLILGSLTNGPSSTTGIVVGAAMPTLVGAMLFSIAFADETSALPPGDACLGPKSARPAS